MAQSRASLHLVLCVSCALQGCQGGTTCTHGKPQSRLRKHGGACVQGEVDTTDYRVFLQQEGRDVSTWHDVPLRNEDGTLNFVCEIPKDTSAKMEVATVGLLTLKITTQRADESLSPVSWPVSSCRDWSYYSDWPTCY